MTLGRLVLDAVQRHTGTALRIPKPDGGHQDTSFAELGTAACEIAAGLRTLGLGPGSRIAILGDTRPEWTVSDCGVLLAGAAVVPIYQTNAPAECRYVLEHSGAHAVICENAQQLAKVREVQPGCPALTHVFTMEPTDDADALPLSELRARGARAGADPDTIRGQLDDVGQTDVATIVYTSGTTGPPKGCVLTHANVLATIEMYRSQVPVGPESVIFFFLPLAHVLARLTEFVALDAGATLGFWSRDPKRLLDDLAALRPTLLPSVPRLFEKIHTRALATASDAGGIQGAIFTRALSTARRARQPEGLGGGLGGIVMRVRRELADRLVLTKVRAALGGRVELALTGAAPISPEVLAFFDACGIVIVEGYGMTESCAAATLNRPGAVRFGTVGEALPGAEMRIGADGEILLRGPHIFAGYLDDDDATREVLGADGWLHTGDLGSIDSGGYLRITGRKKDLIITSSGKNITPTNLEAELRESRWISQAVVYGDQHPYLVAMLTLDPDEAPALAGQLGVSSDPESMATDSRVHDALQEEIDRVNSEVARIEQIKRFTVLGRDLSLEQDEVTPTLKVKRSRVYASHHDVFEALYEG